MWRRARPCDWPGAARPDSAARPSGSLFVHLAVAPDPRFERSGDDLHTTLTVGLAQAALGSECEVETLEGTQAVTVAAGTPYGHVHRIKGEGVPHLRGRGRGDLYVHVVIETPSGLSDVEEGLLRQFAAARGEHVSPPGGGGDGVFSRLRSAFS